jgi:hypothetical protein
VTLSTRGSSSGSPTVTRSRCLWTVEKSSYAIQKRGALPGQSVAVTLDRKSNPSSSSSRSDASVGSSVSRSTTTTAWPRARIASESRGRSRSTISSGLT